MTHGAACGWGRRQFIAGASAFGALALGGAATPGPRDGRIDVHHHISPPSWLAAVKQAKLDSPPMANWSMQKSLEDMEAGGVSTSVMSQTLPHVGFLGREAAARIAREANEYARKVATEHRGRFGVFAMLPMPHVEECLREIEYALDVLSADGVAMLTSYGDKWLGHADFAPVFNELNRRKATVYTHPDRPSCCVNLQPGIPPSVVEFGADTTRAIASLLFSGTSRRCKDINFIFSHGGGVLTAVAERFQQQMPLTPPYQGKFTREVIDAELRRFHYDTAQIANAVTIEALVKLVPVSQVLFGTDFPFRTSVEHARGLAATFKGNDLKAIERGNALRLMPRLKAG